MLLLAAAAINLALAQPVDRAVCLEIGAAAFSMEGERVTVVGRDCSEDPAREHRYTVETQEGRRFVAEYPFLLKTTGRIPPGH
jgi:hypothetical protein